MSNTYNKPKHKDAKPLVCHLCLGRLGVLILRYFFVVFSFLLASCSGDPPLLKTELSNGHEFHSNGGGTGYFTNKQGNRYADIFGIIETGKERWCEGFSWSK